MLETDLQGMKLSMLCMGGSNVVTNWNLEKINLLSLQYCLLVGMEADLVLLAATLLAPRGSTLRVAAIGTLLPFTGFTLFIEGALGGSFLADFFTLTVSFSAALAVPRFPIADG